MIDKKTLWIMCGVPGSGKSWFAKNKLINGPGWMYISRDEIRFSYLKDEDDYFNHEKEVYNEFLQKIKSALNYEGIYNVIADATHLNYPSRHKLLTNLKRIGCNFDNLQIIPVVIEADIDIILERNDKRNGKAKVPHNVIKNMMKQMEKPEGDPDADRYTAIMYVNNGKKNLIETPKFMYKKSDIKMKEIPLKDLIKKEGQKNGGKNLARF